MLTASYLLYLFALVFAPLAFGTIEPWAYMTVETCCFLSLACHLVRVVGKKQQFIKVPGLLPFLLFLTWNLCQLVPLPVRIVQLVSPATLSVYQDALETVHYLPLSLAPHFTVREFFRFSSYLVFYILTIQLLQDRERLRQTVRIVLATGAAIAVEAIVQYLFGKDLAYGFRPSSFGANGAIVGPFFYANHFAGYMEMLVPLAVSLFLIHRSKRRRGLAMRHAILAALEQGVQNKRLLYGLCGGVMLLSILISNSRGGVIASCIGLAWMLTVGWKTFRRQMQHPGRYILVLLLLVLLGAGRVGLHRLDVKFGRIVNENEITLGTRALIWKDALGIARDFPITGTGFGTFGNIFPSYDTLNLRTRTRNAHNDYLENLTEGGVIAVILVLLFLVVQFRHFLHSIRSRQNPEERAYLAGASAGMVALLVHSLAEFQFNMSTAVSLYFFFLCGINIVISQKETENTSIPVHARGTLPSIAGSVSVLVLIGLLITGGIFHVRTQRVKNFLAKNKKIALTHAVDDNTLKETLRDYLEISRENPLMGQQAIAAKAAEVLGDYRLAGRLYREALRFRPTAATTLQHYGLFLSRQGDIRRAERLLQVSIKRHLCSPFMHQVYGFWLLGQGRRQDALRVFKQKIALENRIRSDVAILLKMGFSPEEIRQILPSDLRTWLEFADILDKQGEIEAAGRMYLRVTEAASGWEQATTGFFVKPYSYFIKHKEYDKALQVIASGLEKFPDSAELYIFKGRVLAETGQAEEAAKANEQAFALLEAETKRRPRAWLFTSLYWNYRKLNKLQEAEEVLVRGTEILPKDAGLHLTLGDHYRSRNLLHSAEVEYRLAYALKPGDEKIKKRLELYKSKEARIQDRLDELLGR